MVRFPRLIENPNGLSPLIATTRRRRKSSFA
jgi:hypothetical protein